MTNLVLIGFKNSGKTTFGQQLATRLQRPFLDVDRELEALYLADTGESLPMFAIHQRLGEAAFRALETRAINGLSRFDNAVIATGGGSVLHNGLALKSLGCVLYLQFSMDTLWGFMAAMDRLPSFLDVANPEASFYSLYTKREPIYERLADISVALDGVAAEAVLPRLIKVVEERT